MVRRCTRRNVAPHRCDNESPHPPQFFPLSLEATDIFRALGFANPEDVDLNQGHKLARKQGPNAPGENASDPLCFRY